MLENNISVDVIAHEALHSIIALTQVDLLSAVYAYGIDNIRVVLDGAEVPVMDGSSASFCMMLDEAGIRKLDAT